MSAALKGPWALCYDGVIEDADGGTVIGFPFDSYREFNQQSDFDKAKQRVIAAAPELLAALQDLANDISERFDLDSPSTNPGIKATVEAARAAIAKATGAAL